MIMENGGGHSVRYRTFCKNQREAAITINKIIDDYWNQTLSEQEMKECIFCIYKNNDDKIIRNGTYTKIVQQQCGKKRISVMTKVLEEMRSDDEN